MSDPILIYDQDVVGERRFVYYAGRLLAIIVMERRMQVMQVDWVQ